MQSLILATPTAEITYFIHITKIFDLVTFSKLAFSDINMSATYANLTCQKTRGKPEIFENLCKPDEDIQ